MKKLKFFSNVTFISAMVIGCYALIEIYLLNASAPEGVCPVYQNRWLMNMAILLAVGSLLIDWYVKRQTKKEMIELEEDED